MGYFDTYCCFCAGPLNDAHSTWLGQLGEPGDPWPPKEGWMENPPGFPVPTKSREEIVTITKDDGAFWGDWVVVCPFWKDSEYVSPPCVDNEIGIPGVQGDEDDTWYEENDPGSFLCIHRTCLSIICRSLHITPKVLWETILGDDTTSGGTPAHSHPQSGILKSVQYYDIEGRQGQAFEYARERYTTADDGSSKMWYDPASMDDCQWLLARPTVFPKLEKLVERRTAHSLSSTTPPLLRVFTIPELFDHCLSFLKSPLTPHANVNECTPYPKALSALLALTQCSSELHILIGCRQDLFYQLALDSGWMLPLCPADWAEWKARQNPAPLPLLSECGDWDWRGYLLACVRREDPHMRNRARFRRMVVQFALPKTFVPDHEAVRSWVVGTLEDKTEMSEPDPWAWEVRDTEVRETET